MIVGRNGTTGYNVRLGASGNRYEGFIFDKSVASAADSAAIGTYAHVLFQSSAAADGISIEIDGVPVGPATPLRNIGFDQDFTLGSQAGGGNPFRGAVYAPQVWHRVLTTDEKAAARAFRVPTAGENWTFVAGGGAKSPDGGGYTSGAIDTSGAKLIVVAVNYYDGLATPALSDSKGNVWTPLTPQVGPDDITTLLYYCIGPVAGSGHTFTIVGATTFSAIEFGAWACGGSTPEFDQETAGSVSAATSVQPGSLTSTVAPALIVSGLGTRNIGNSIDEDASVSGQTKIGFQTAASGQCLGCGLAYVIQNAAPSANNPTWSWTTADSASAVGAVFLSVP